MSEPVSNEWQRVARLVIRRRVDLGYHQQSEFASSAGLSIRTLNNIENSRRQSYDGSTIALLERGLEWEPGSIDAILAGGEPAIHVAAAAGDDVTIPRATLARIADAVDALRAELEAALDEPRN